MAEISGTSVDKVEQPIECAARRYLYVWEGPVRIIHWLNFFCIIILSFTGYFIHDPFMSSAQHPYIMGHMRHIHYVTGVVFSVSILARLYWFLGDSYFASWRAIPNPFDKNNRKTFWAYIRFYTFLGKETPHLLGHNPVAFCAYTLLFLLFFLQILTGFALWAQADPYSSLYAVTGWIFGLVSNQWVRWFHFMVMFLIAGFVINHIYSIVLFDFKSKSGEISSIFSGWKPDRRD
ncbi:MAG: Ni/Fe-hydrogenase, b-type cytochrome subunit [Desulfuromonadales bacterium]|nr:Ni/Fe-hydrogenase, b-type cytochrome subunit [Desulfuromonadales bacterium]